MARRFATPGDSCGPKGQPFLQPRPKAWDFVATNDLLRPEGPALQASRDGLMRDRVPGPKGPGCVNGWPLRAAGMTPCCNSGDVAHLEGVANGVAVRSKPCVERQPAPNGAVLLARV